MRRIKHIVLLLFILYTSCSEDPVFDFVIGGQPIILDEDFYELRLNIFGVLRNDATTDSLNSKIYIHRTKMAVNDTISDSLYIYDADVYVYKLENGTIKDTFNFSLVDSSYYKNEIIAPNAGETYQLYIETERYPVIMSSTIIPNKPVLEGGIEKEGNNISFNLMYDSTIYLYDIAVFDNDILQVYKRVQPMADEKYMPVELNLPTSNYSEIQIFSYDKSLATYYSLPNKFIKPNTYRPPFTTVEGGYGCFGSINYLIIGSK